MERYRCNVCREFVAESIHLLLTHIGRIHRNEPNFHVVCGLNGCAKTYKNFWSFRNHLIRKHGIVTAKEGIGGNRQDLNQDHNEEDVINEIGVQIEAEGQEDNFDREIDLSKTNALCILKFKETTRVPQTVVDSFVDNATQVTRASVDFLRSGVTNCLQKAGIDINTVHGLNELFDEDNSIANPFKDIYKEPLQYRYYKDEFNLVVSKSTGECNFIVHAWT